MDPKTTQNDDRRLIVVAKYGDYRECRITYPGPREVLLEGWRCNWCDTVFLCEDVELIPDHRCLGPSDGVRVFDSTTP
jgi:hypothetical protein